MIRTLVAGALLFVPGVALAAPWAVDTSHSSARFSVRHMMVSNVYGQMGPITGTVDFNEKSPEKSKIDITIDVKGINTADEKRDEHLRSADFFDVEKHPAITFKSKRTKKTKRGQYEVFGTLTMRGVSKEVTLLVDGPQPVIKGPWGNWRTGAAATTTLNRKDFGITWNKVLDSGGVALGEEVKIEIDLEILTKDRGTT